MFLVNWCAPPPCRRRQLHRTRALLGSDTPPRRRRFYSALNYLGLYNKNAKVLFLVRPASPPPPAAR
jgi:hypothetical protein